MNFPHPQSPASQSSRAKSPLRKAPPRSGRESVRGNSNNVSRIARILAMASLCVCAILGLAQCGRSERPRMFVIGLDGATWDLIGPWMEQGELPNLAALREQSSWGTMNSVIPYLPPPAWTSAITGVNPGRHNIFDFQRRLPDTGAVVTETAHSRRSPPIWNMLHGRGL